MFAVETIQRNFYLPDPLNDLFNELSQKYGKKKYWSVVSAAILAYQAMEQGDRESLRLKVAAAQGDEKEIRRLIADAKAASLRGDLLIVDQEESGESPTSKHSDAQLRPKGALPLRPAKPKSGAGK